MKRAAVVGGAVALALCAVYGIVQVGWSLSASLTGTAKTEHVQLIP